MYVNVQSGYHGPVPEGNGAGAGAVAETGNGPPLRYVHTTLALWSHISGPSWNRVPAGQGWYPDGAPLVQMQNPEQSIALT